MHTTKTSLKEYNVYSYYKRLTKAEQLAKYLIIEPLLTECKKAGFKTVDPTIGSRPEFKDALKARADLFLSLNGLITRLALNRGVKPEELEDVFSYCTVYLDKALMRFDYSKNFAYTSLAFVYLRGAILNFIRKNNLIVLSVKDFQACKPSYTLTGLELQPEEQDADTIGYILNSLNDSEARLITWYYRLNETSQVKDTIVSLTLEGIDCTPQAVASVISNLQEVFANG